MAYADVQHLKGNVQPGKVGDVLDSWNTEKVQFVEILEAAQMLQQAEQNLAEQEVKLRKEEEKVTKFKREDSGLRFTITCLVAFTVFQAGLLIWIATHRYRVNAITVETGLLPIAVHSTNAFSD